MSKYFWVFIIVALALTFIVVGAWYMATLARDRKSDRKCCIRLPFGLFGTKDGKDDDDPQSHKKLSGRRIFNDVESGIPPNVV